MVSCFLGKSRMFARKENTKQNKRKEAAVGFHVDWAA